MQKRVLIIFYSFSSQTLNLLKSLAEGLEEGGATVCWEQLKPLVPPPFPAGSYWAALKMMFLVFCKWRIAIEPPDRSHYISWDLIICAGPTWSYHASGPMLYFLDVYGREMLKDQDVLPFISCRSYWRLHHWEMKKSLRGAGIRFLKPRVFFHPSPGLWCTLGVFLTIAGKMPKIWQSWLQSHCPRFGHSPQQIVAARSIGRSLANRLQKGEVKGMQVD